MSRRLVFGPGPAPDHVETEGEQRWVRIHGEDLSRESPADSDVVAPLERTAAEGTVVTVDGDVYVPVVGDWLSTESKIVRFSDNFPPLVDYVVTLDEADTTEGSVSPDNEGGDEEAESSDSDGNVFGDEESEGNGEEQPAKEPQSDTVGYLERLMMLIPAEIVLAWGLVVGFAQTDGITQGQFQIAFVFAAILALVLGYADIVKKDLKGSSRKKWGLLQALSAVPAFALWAIYLDAVANQQMLWWELSSSAAMLLIIGYTITLPALPIARRMVADTREVIREEWGNWNQQTGLAEESPIERQQTEPEDVPKSPT